MSNQAVDIARAAHESAIASGAVDIGFQVNYDADSISILRTDLKAIFESEGYAGYVHDKMEPVAALARAKGDPLPKGFKVLQFARPNADTPVSYGIYHQTSLDGESGDRIDCGARVRLDKATGQIVALPPDGCAPHAECMEIAGRIAAAANKLINYAETVDVTTSAKNVVMGAMHGMAMCSRGGVYFIRPAYRDAWFRLADKLKPYGFYNVGIGISGGVSGGQNLDAAKHFVKKGLESKLTELRDRIAKFDDKTRDSNVKLKLEDCESISGEAELYAEILGGWKDALLASVKECKQKCLRKMAGEDVDFSFTPEAPPAPPAPPTPAAPPAPAAPSSAAAAPWHAPLGDVWGSFG